MIIAAIAQDGWSGSLNAERYKKSPIPRGYAVIILSIDSNDYPFGMMAFICIFTPIF
jgi:hypothetical protein